MLSSKCWPFHSGFIELSFEMNSDVSTINVLVTYLHPFAFLQANNSSIARTGQVFAES